MATHQHGSHSHSHAHGGGNPSDPRNRRRLAFVFMLALAYSMVELAGGIYTSSLALLADAFHLLSDVAALGISLFAAWLSQRPATSQRTFGYRRAEILAALANGATLSIMAILISVQAVRRFGEPQDVNGAGVVFFALGALVYECVGLWILSRSAESNLNIRGAWLHILSDALGSLGAIASGALIWAYGWVWADPIASILISLLILHAAWNLIREAVHILMENAPTHLDTDQIRNAIASLAVVRDVHDLHVWSIGDGDIALSTHVVVAKHATDSNFLTRVRELLRDHFAISHATIQVEEADRDANGNYDGSPCPGACTTEADKDAGKRPTG